MVISSALCPFLQAIGLLTAFLSTHPSAYDEEKETTATSVKQAGELIAGMTDTEALAQVRHQAPS